MDHDDIEKLAAELQEKGSAWGPFQVAASTSLVLYFAWAGSLALGLCKVYLQVPYVPSSVKQVRNMMSLLQGRSGKLVDLGSGDGRIADLSDCNNVTVFLAPSLLQQNGGQKCISNTQPPTETLPQHSFRITFADHQHAYSDLKISFFRR